MRKTKYYIKKNTTKVVLKDGKIRTHVYFKLAQNIREGSKIRTKVIENLGKDLPDKYKELYLRKQRRKK